MFVGFSEKLNSRDVKDGGISSSSTGAFFSPVAQQAGGTHSSRFLSKNSKHQESEFIRADERRRKVLLLLCDTCSSPVCLQMEFHR